MNFRLLAAFLSLSACALQPALAQSAGQSITVNTGIVTGAESVQLQSSGGSAGGAVVGGVIGYNAGSGKSSSKKRRHAIIGSAVGSAAGSQATTPGMQYQVNLDDGSTVVVVSDRLDIDVGDCVSVEQARGSANIRKQDAAACEAGSGPVVEELREEFEEEADECAQAKQQLLDATTPEEVQMAESKARILCN